MQASGLEREPINSEALTNVRFGAHSGLKSDIAQGPKSARFGLSSGLRGYRLRPWRQPRVRSTFLSLLPTDPTRPLSKDTLEAKWQRIRVAAGLEDVHLHDLRHTVGTYAAQSGANAFLVRDLLRHRTLAITGGYVHRADDPLRILSDVVSERIAAGLAGRKAGDVVPLKRNG